MQSIYATLKVSPNATQDQIKSQYRKLVREYHPDQFLEPQIKLYYEEKLKEINQAYTNVVQSHLSSNSQTDSVVLPRRTVRSRISILMGTVSLFILLILIVALSFVTITFSKVTLIRNYLQTVEIVSDNQRQPTSQQNGSSQSKIISNSIPKVIVQTPKLGTTVSPITPLRFRTMYRDKKMTIEIH